MAITRCEIKSRSLLADGQEFGDVGPYERLDGTVQVAVDPDHPRNQTITDLALAPRGADGRVYATADISILKPVDPARGNRRLLLDILNRGRRLALRFMNRALMQPDPASPLDPGNGFLMRHGYTVAWCGWQHDVPDMDGLLRLMVPDAVTDTGPISGQIAVMFRPSVASQVQLLSDRQHRPYPVADLGEVGATLTVQDHENAPAEVVPRDQWAFARLESGRVVPDDNHLYLESGLVKGRVYRVTYTTTGAPVLGLGLLATRDMVSFLRHGSADAGNPCAGELDYAYGFGASQSGRFLRQFLYLGLNEDEAERLVFDGVIPHIAGGGRGEFNQRFGQPSSIAKQSIGNMFPFADTEQADSETGQTGSLLSRLDARGAVPKIFFINTSAEYWRGDAALIHTSPDGTRDLDPSPQVRLYLYAGTQHASGFFPLINTNPADGSRGQAPFNSVDYTPLLRAALVRLDQWVGTGELPPPSCYPRLDGGDLVTPAETATAFTAIPGVSFPAHVDHMSRLDFGPEATAGIAALPARVGRGYSLLVPAVDADGNERPGIRLPDISVPLATYTGWNLRHPDMGGAEYLMGLMGSTRPFPATSTQQAELGDPRTSIETRYGAKDDYLQLVRQAAQQLIEQGYLLAEDLDGVVEQAAERYEAFGG